MSLITRRFRPEVFTFAPTGVWQPVGFVALAAVFGLMLVWLPVWQGAALGVGTAVLLLTLIQPLVGLAAALLLGPLGALESVFLGGSVLDSGQVMLLLTLVVWLGRGLRRRRIVIPATFLNGPLLLFLLVTAVSLLDAPSIPVGLKEWLKWVEITLIMWLVADAGQGERRRWPWVLGMLLAAGFIQAMIGIWQFGLRGDGPEHFLILERFYRAYGTFEQPNPFGGFINLTALLAVGSFVGVLVWWWQRGWRAETGDWRLGVSDRLSCGWQHGRFAVHPLILLLFVGSVAAATGMALVFSWSRGAWLGFGSGAGILLLFLPRKRWQGVALVAGTAVLLLLALQFNLLPAGVADRLVSFRQDLRFGDVRGVDINDANYAVLERLAHWQAARDMARDQLWLGVGFGNYESAYADYALINWPAPLGHAHNYYLNLLAETGVLGLLAYLGLWTAVFWQTVRQLRQEDWRRRGIALGLLAAWTALTVHHLVDKLYVNNIYIHLGVMLGLLQLLERKRSASAKFGQESGTV